MSNSSPGSVPARGSPVTLRIVLPQPSREDSPTSAISRVGGTILAVLLYRSRLVPRWIAVLGLIGYPVLFVGCILDLFGVTDVTKGAGLIAVAPGGLFELILPIWLLAKGFNSSSQALPGKDDPQIVKTG